MYISNSYRLEVEKNEISEMNKIKELEAVQYEINKQKASQMHDELRLLEVDHAITRNKYEPVKLTKMRTKLEKLEMEQSSRKLMLQQMGEMEELNEQLARAAQHGDLEACSQLVRCGASVNYIDAAGYTPFHYACSFGQSDIVKFFLEFGADSTSYISGHAPIIAAAKANHLDVIKVLLEYGASVEDKGMEGTTALIASIERGTGNMECFDYLLENGADLNAIDRQGNTALHSAVKFKDQSLSLNTIYYLISKGIDMFLVNQKGYTALNVAQFETKSKVVIEALNTEMIEFEKLHNNQEE